MSDAEAFDCRTAGFHDRGAAETVDRREQRGEFEKAMDGGDGAILRVHGVIVSRGAATVI